jgi:hypothetical protein
MKTRTALAAASIVVIGGLGTAVGVASAQSDPAPTPSSAPSGPPTGEDPGAKGEFVCANLAQIEKVQADHATLIQDRLALLATAKTAAQDAGKTKAVERIDARTARLTERQQKVAERQQKLADFAATNCTS